jgi:predicted enzyme related to lactoylglutathione lyase
MDPYKTHGAFSWSELMTTDPEGASRFYGGLFGWTIKNMDMGTGPYHVANVGETSVGGIMGPPPGAEGMPPAWGCYITVDNVDETIAKCAALGGKTVMPPMDVTGVGRMAVLQDPQGAVFSIITYSSAG